MPFALILCALLDCSLDAQTPIGFVLPPVAATTNREIVPFVAVRAIEEDGNGFRYYGRGRGEMSAGVCTVDLDARTNRQIVALEQQRLDELLDRFVTSERHAIVRRT